ncbi:HNH endonuclease signature motif containing protein [Terrabacter sp. LjRoot27]|uniref:hypothetical protein n=1 Tax=Terrabacter sp. LjRoot27 TaxID=3342306 RepID=UPI003ECCE811
MATDPSSVRCRSEHALRDRFVRVEPGLDPGTTWWKASLPARDSMQAWGAVDELAHEYVRADPARSIDQARADAFLDLLLGSAQVSTTVELVVPTFVGPASDDRRGVALRGPDEAAAVPSAIPAADVRPSAPSRRPRPGDGPSRSSSVDVGAFDLAHITGPRLAPEHAIGSELFGLGSAPRAGCDADPAAAGALLAHQAAMPVTVTGAVEDAASPQRLPGERWRPPKLGVRHPRFGWMLAPVLAEVLSDPDVVLRVSRADALTGVTVARDPATYRPNAALAQRVRDRDRTCRFPGCGVAARRCDLDHVVRFPDGSTTECNLVCLCRTHHGFKHHAGWTLTMDADGTCTWTAPTGRCHVTRPADVRLDAA